MVNGHYIPLRPVISWEKKPGGFGGGVPGTLTFPETKPASLQVGNG